MIQQSWKLRHKNNNCMYSILKKKMCTDMHNKFSPHMFEHAPKKERVVLVCATTSAPLPKKGSPE